MRGLQLHIRVSHTDTSSHGAKMPGCAFVGDHKRVIAGKRIFFMKLGAGSHGPKFAPSLTIGLPAPPILRQGAITVLRPLMV